MPLKRPESPKIQSPENTGSSPVKTMFIRAIILLITCSPDLISKEYWGGYVIATQLIFDAHWIYDF